MRKIRFISNQFKLWIDNELLEVQVASKVFYLIKIAAAIRTKNLYNRDFFDWVNNHLFHLEAWVLFYLVWVVAFCIKSLAGWLNCIDVMACIYKIPKIRHCQVVRVNFALPVIDCMVGFVY